ncbi:MAG TPA: PKD domain-containing protein, partial [Candidatus Thermoplasmatota archaeon]|nr:PKD domain-containing protein [Candidatus Thermoplasmatota archaeon]
YLALRAFSGGALPVTLPTVRVEGGPAVAGREAALHAEASVPVGRIEAWRWDLGDGAGATGERIAHAYDSAGPRTVTVTVTTDRGVEGTARVLLDVLPADRLPIEVPSVARRGDAVEARADVVAGTVLRFDWGDGNATDWTTTPRATHAYSRLGAYVVRAEARAPAGDRSSGEATVVVENVLPVLVVPPKHEADRVAPARLVAAAADPDGPEPRVTWTFPDGAALEGPVVERRFEALGEVVVRVEATDGDGGVVEEETRVAVVNLPPTLALVVPTVVRVGDTVVLRAEAGDADGGAPAVRWMLPGGGEVTGPALAWVADSDGERVFAAIATDLDGGTARANATVHVLPEVAAEAPLALVARADPVAARAGDDVFLALRPSGGQPPYRLRALRDGVEVAVVDGRAALGALDAAFAWVAEARDAAGAVARVEGSLAPAPDAAPKASLGVAADGRTVVADASATRDPEARPLAYRFVWGDGEATPWGPDPFAVHTYRDDGAYEISVEALDAAGQAARATQGVVLAVPIVAAPTRSPTLAPVTDPGAAPEPYRPPRAGALETHPRELPTSAFAGALVLVLAAALPHRARAAQGRSRARRSRR